MTHGEWFSRVPLPRSFYDRDTSRVARELIGKRIVHVNGEAEISGRIIETEAYLGMVDPASHLFNGFTKRTEGTWGSPGSAYVFLIHGHACLNAITLADWPYGCVLIRGVENGDDGQIVGPGRVTRLLKIDRSSNGLDLTGERLFIKGRTGPVPGNLRQGPRIGISKAKDLALRFRKPNELKTRSTGIQ